MHTVLDNRPDLYLDEMRLELEQVCGVSVSLPTIWRTLVKSGYTMKKVCCDFVVNILVNLLLYTTALSSCD
jgi:hypothetical protein